MFCLAAWSDALPTAPTVLDAREVWRRVEAAVAMTFAVPVRSLRAPTRAGAEVTFARHAAIYVTHTVFGLTYGAIADLCGRDHSTVAYACQTVEQQRDQAEIDRTLLTLTDLCRNTMGCRPMLRGHA